MSFCPNTCLLQDLSLVVLSEFLGLDDLDYGLSRLHLDIPKAFDIVEGFCVTVQCSNADPLPTFSDQVLLRSSVYTFDGRMR